MPRFVFLSGPECGNVDAVTNYGIHFPRGVAVEVADDFVADKLRGHPFFATVAEPSDPADINGDDFFDKAELIAEAERRGIDIDKRWSAARIAAMLAEAE